MTELSKVVRMPKELRDVGLKAGGLNIVTCNIWRRIIIPWSFYAWELWTNKSVQKYRDFEILHRSVAYRRKLLSVCDHPLLWHVRLEVCGLWMDISINRCCSSKDFAEQEHHTSWRGFCSSDCDNILWIPRGGIYFAWYNEDCYKMSPLMLCWKLHPKWFTYLPRTCWKRVCVKCRRCDSPVEKSARWQAWTAQLRWRSCHSYATDYGEVAWLLYIYQTNTIWLS